MQKVLMLLLLLLSCVALPVAAQPVSMLVYRVWEQGSEPYLSRVLVGEDYVRLDEGDNNGGFTLFDRNQEILYNVSVEERAVVVIDPTTVVPEQPPSLVLQEQVDTDEQAPAIAGHQPKNVRLLANGEECASMVVVEGLMRDAVDALAELKIALARVQYATLDAMPLDSRTPCDLATNVYAPDRALRFGLPIQERSEGRSQSLVDMVENHEVDDKWFEIPAGFDRQPLFGSGS